MSARPPATSYRPDEGRALELDEADPLRGYRERFHIPRLPDGSPAIYLCGNSLGLQPRGVREAVDQELADWADLGVRGHFEGERPWYAYHEGFREAGARLVGARPGEVVMMNSLTVNLHLMMVSFYRPTAERFRILIDWPPFPSDLYAVKTQIRHHGLDPELALLPVEPRPGEHTIRMEDIETVIEKRGEEIALVLMNGVNFLTGQAFDMAAITAAARARGCTVGFDLAHAAGNLVLELHEWGVDFAVWCSYKYLNAGPGAVAGCFVHERHGRDTALQRFGGWWGNDPETRFRMRLEPEFTPQPGAAGWQLSNPPILAMAPLHASLSIFDEVGMPALREKSVRLSGYLEHLIDRLAGDRCEIITPRDPLARGCQLSILVHQGAREAQRALEERGVVCDFREPNVLRVAPVPLYNTFHEMWRFAHILRE
ncbi:MAG: kynureninase [Gemmatimonadota bacterium]